jgi:hypothetical protein
MIWLYLDPGSGSFLIQLLIASIAGIVIFVGVSWRKVKRLFTKNKLETNENEDDDENDDDIKKD